MSDCVETFRFPWLGESSERLMTALEIRRDRTAVVLRKLARSETDGRVARRILAIPRQAVVFAHGFNVSFDNALLRTAQLAHDLDFDGPAGSCRPFRSRFGRAEAGLWALAAIF